MPFKNQTTFFIEEEFQLLPLFKVYKIKNKRNEDIAEVKQIFSATSKALELYTNKVKPPLEFEIFDSKEKKLASFKRNWNILLTDAEIYNSKGKLTAAVKQEFDFFNFKLSIKNLKHQLLAELTGSKRSKRITITNNRKKTEGRISPKWGGVVKEFVTQKNSYKIELEQPLRNSNSIISYIVAVVLLDLMIQNK